MQKREGKREFGTGMFSIEKKERKEEGRRLGGIQTEGKEKRVLNERATVTFLIFWKGQAGRAAEMLAMLLFLFIGPPFEMVGGPVTSVGGPLILLCDELVIRSWTTQLLYPRKNIRLLLLGVGHMTIHLTSGCVFSLR